MTRVALVVNDLRIRRLGAQHPVEPYRQLVCRGHLGHRCGFVMTAASVLFGELLIVPDRRLCGFYQHGAQKYIALFGNGPQATLAARTMFAGDQSQIAGYLLASLESRYIPEREHEGQRGNRTDSWLSHQ